MKTRRNKNIFIVKTERGKKKSPSGCLIRKGQRRSSVLSRSTPLCGLQQTLSAGELVKVTG
jgi:hypothetical protein